MTTPTEVDMPTRLYQHPQGIGLIIAYKLVTTGAEFIVGASLWVIGSTALTEELNAAANIIRRHVAEGTHTPTNGEGQRTPIGIGPKPD